MMTSDLESNPCRKRVKKRIKNACSVKTVKKRLPILEWLPKYKTEYIIQDMIAGITVALTAIPQGIAYALIAGLPPEHGLYASLTSGVVYVFFGSCYNVTVGPTAILAAMTARYVSNYSTDFAILAAFLSGLFILFMGVFHLGFLVDFISMPVISGFTTAAALQIASSQLKSLFGTSGSSGNYFAESVYNFAMNIRTVKLWESVLGFSTILMLILLKKMGQGCKRTDGFIKRTRWFVSLCRNAIVVVIGMIITYILKVTLDSEPLSITGDIGSGLPDFTWPPFSTTAGNETLNFIDMLSVLGPGSVAIPLVALFESVAIAKAFAEGGRIDATQEMIAIGLCNIIGSFGQSMPITGSFARTALNHDSGVVTPAGGVTKVLLIIFALTYLTSTFYYIPKASLAGLIITALFTMIDYEIYGRLWKNSKRELLVMLITIVVCLFYGLEYGMLAGVIIEACVLLYNVSQPTVNVNVIKTDKVAITIVPLIDSVSYCAAEYVRKAIIKASLNSSNTVIIIDGTNLKNMDFTVASNLMLIVQDLEKKSRLILLYNFNLGLKNLCLDINPFAVHKFVHASNILDHVSEILPNNI
ncbi:hypothetical protein O3G_MSEX002202 [Manduca sexta]|uniref:STAS domain-containing protein n=1 Tax=Manduca sexta TaxID=7130 RepID=A0A921YN27_MANSE|nr:hypothetical protein O3G_MSEX002202 [Manduca sexta]